MSDDAAIRFVRRRRRRTSERLLLCALSFPLVACGDGEDDGGGSGGQAANGGSAAEGGGGIGGRNFNQCGVAAPLPAETGRCTAVGSPGITNFDDYDGAPAASYSYYLNATPPASDAVLGAIQHVSDGSDMNGGTSVVATEMVPGQGDVGHALQISNTSAANWGGLLMFFFPGAGSSSCLDASRYDGLEFSIRGRSPSGRFGVSLGMLDTTPTSDGGLCDNASASDCKNAVIELSLPADEELWTPVRVPWSSFTPGVGSGNSCVPLTGQNIVRLVIQPFMSYPPPDFMLEPGAYTIAVDDVRFF